MTKKSNPKLEVVFHTIKERRSCRFFREGVEVPPEDVETILEAARWAPSARNLQPLEYVIVRDAERRKRLAGFSRQKQPEDVDVCIVVVGDLKRAKEVGEISEHDTTTQFKGIQVFVKMDAAAAVQNMLLTAEAMGYNTLWISAFDDDALEDFLRIPQHFTPLSIVCIGEKAKRVQVPPKRRLEERVHYELWAPKEQDESYKGFSKKINVEY